MARAPAVQSMWPDDRRRRSPTRRRRRHPSLGGSPETASPALRPASVPCCIDPVDPALRPRHGVQRRWLQGDTNSRAPPTHSRSCPQLARPHSQSLRPPFIHSIRSGRATKRFASARKPRKPQARHAPVFSWDLPREKVGFGHAVLHSDPFKRHSLLRTLERSPRLGGATGPGSSASAAPASAPPAERGRRRDRAIRGGRRHGATASGRIRDRAGADGRTVRT